MTKTYDTYKDSCIAWIGEIPSEWKVVRQKNVFTLGKELVGEKWSSTQLLSLTTKGIKCVNIGTTSGKVPDSYNTYQIVKPNNLVMCLFDLDCSAVFSGISNCNGMISPAYKVLTVNESSDPRYYAYWFDYIFDGRKYMFLSKNIRYSLTYDEFASLGIVMPSLEEQQSIASFLDKKCSEIDSLISLQEEMITELQAYKQSVITDAVTKGTNSKAPMIDSGVEWIGDIPEGWKVIRIKWLLNERKERSESGSEEPLSMSQKYGLIPTKEMDSIPNMASSFVGAKITYPGDIVFNKLKAHLGVFSVSKYNGLVSPDYAVYYPTALSNARYLEYLFKTPKYINEFRKRSSGVGAGLTRLYTGDLFDIHAIYPPISVQKEIAQYIDDKISQIDSLISIKQSKIQELKDYKKSIIYEYVTGKKKV